MNALTRDLTDPEPAPRRNDMTFWKAVRPNGGSFFDPDLAYRVGEITRHPRPHLDRGASGYLSIADAPTECIGMTWPCRLFEVEPVGDHQHDDGLPHKVACTAVRVVREVDAHLALGPQGEAVAALIDRASQMTEDDGDRLAAAWDSGWFADEDADRSAGWSAAWSVAWSAAQNAAQNAVMNAVRNADRSAAWSAAWSAARNAVMNAAWSADRAAARNAAWSAAWSAAEALLVRDFIGTHGFTQEHYDVLTRAWRTAIGPIHPDDLSITTEES